MRRYKGMIRGTQYDRVGGREENTACVENLHAGVNGMGNFLGYFVGKNREQDNESESDDSSIYQVVPKVGDGEDKQQLD